jgi:hypothetical protein
MQSSHDSTDIEKSTSNLIHVTADQPQKIHFQAHSCGLWKAMIPLQAVSYPHMAAHGGGVERKMRYKKKNQTGHRMKVFCSLISIIPSLFYILFNKRSDWFQLLLKGEDYTNV